MPSLTILTILLPLLSSAQTHTVKVGHDGFTMEPDKILAGVGDTIAFDFYPKNHSVAQSSWEKPCEPLSGEGDTKPIFSGFFPVDDYAISHKRFTITINNTDPIWLYCSQASHCKSGQVMVINPDDASDETLEKYKEAAGNAGETVSPTEISGGVITDDDDDSDDVKTTKGNPGTPATATMSSSSSTSGSSTSTSSTSSSAASTNAAGKIGAQVVVPMLAGAYAAGMCNFLT